MQLEVMINGLSIILGLGFAMAALIAFSTLDKQKEITAESRYGRQTSTSEIVYVNIGLILVAVLIYTKDFKFLPALLSFMLLILLNSRMRSGVAPIGVFIGTTYLPWKSVKSYNFVNDDISTIKLEVRGNDKIYVLRIDKEQRKLVESYMFDNSIPLHAENYT